MITKCTALIPLYQQDFVSVSVKGNFASGDEIADALIAKMPTTTEWRSLFVTVQLFAFGQQSRQKIVTSVTDLRSGICREFAGLMQRGAGPSSVSTS